VHVTHRRGDDLVPHDVMDLDQGPSNREVRSWTDLLVQVPIE
jgi:hypothetical protein